VSAAEEGRTIVPGGAIVRFLSRVGTLEMSYAIDRTGECDRSQLQKGTCRTELELEKKLKIHKLKIKKTNKNKN
jgi:hypothetical protein